jgi:hypothetical protein
MPHTQAPMLAPTSRWIRRTLAEGGVPTILLGTSSHFVLLFVILFRVLSTPRHARAEGGNPQRCVRADRNPAEENHSKKHPHA